MFDPTTIKGPGIYYDVPNDFYHSKECPGVSRSDLNLIAKSPLHYLHKHNMIPKCTEEKIMDALSTDDELTESEDAEDKKEAEKEKKALIIGRAFHTIVLEPEKFDLEFAVGPSCGKKSKADKETWANFKLANPDKTILTKKDYEMISNMRDAIKRSKCAMEMLDPTQGRPEVTAISADPITKVLRKVRADFARYDGIIVDLKSTADNASANSFRSDIVKYSYDKQSSYYLDTFTDATENIYKNFIFIVVEKKAPFGVAIYLLNEACVDVGRKLYQRDLKIYADAFRWQNREPLKIEEMGYPDMIQTIDMSRWGFDYENRKGV
jgi:hypothetical protein